MIFDLAAKGELLDAIKKVKFLQEKQAGPWFTQLVLGLQYIHEAGVAHRDLKCENVLLDCNCNVRISDFGFARLFDKKTEEKDFSRTYCGSYAYAAPEVLRGLPYHPHLSGENSFKTPPSLNYLDLSFQICGPLVLSSSP